MNSILQLCLVAFLTGPTTPVFPYEEAGLSDRRAAVHLLDRFGFGPRPGDLDAMTRMGLETWFMRQLQGSLPDVALERRLSQLNTHGMSLAEIAKTFIPGARVARLAREAGVIDDPRERDNLAKIAAFRREKGYRPMKDLMHDLYTQKLTRAVYSEHQVREALTDFWFNHFYVSVNDNQARPFVMDYEDTVIRANVFGSFEAMLTAGAKHPAMLFYLDNNASTANPDVLTTMDTNRSMRSKQPRRKSKAGQNRGINENYARELLELHTLGVDGGYTQQDIKEAARILTGWSIFPIQWPNADRLKQRGRKLGFVSEGLFFFRANMHDAGSKTVLGTTFKPGGGLKEGEQLLTLLAHHPSTARFITTKFARRFVSENPPASLLTKLEHNFIATKGDLKQLLLTLVSAPEFWAPETVDARIKPPLQLAASAMRALEADLTWFGPMKEWLDKMGQPLYGYKAPTGFPDEDAFWISSGNLANRMSFATTLASGDIEGVIIDWAVITSKPDALAARLIPERDTSKLFTNLAEKTKRLPESDSERTNRMLLKEYGLENEWITQDATRRNGYRTAALILGSPTFQRY